MAWWLVVLGWFVAPLGTLAGVGLGQRRTAMRELTQAEQSRVDLQSVVSRRTSVYAWQAGSSGGI